jgi:hypothetical protein
MRGRAARTQINKSETKVVSNVKVKSFIFLISQIARNREALIKLIKMMFMYSAIKIRAKLPALNSTLKPDTSSDSPSAKSKGVRFVSAREVINHKIAKGVNMSA